MRFLVVVFLSLFFFNFSYAEEKIILSTIYTKQIENKYEKLSLLANYLEKTNKDGLKFDVKLFKSIDTVIKAINSKQVHIFIDSLYATKLVQSGTDISIDIKNWKNGKEGYKSVIFTKSSSSINSLKDLENRTIAFEDEYSTSAYFIPRKILEKYGLSLSSIKLKNRLRYIFAFSEENVVTKVFFNQVDAGALDDKTFYKVNNNNQFKIVYKSELLPRSIVSFSNSLPLSNKNEIIRVLFEMEKTLDGQKVLSGFEESKRFSILSEKELNFIKSL